MADFFVTCSDGIVQHLNHLCISLYKSLIPLSQVPVANENQQVVQQQYQQQVMVPVSQSVQGPMPVYYSVITPTQQSSTRYALAHHFIIPLVCCAKYVNIKFWFVQINGLYHILLSFDRFQVILMNISPKRSSNHVSLSIFVNSADICFKQNTTESFIQSLHLIHFGCSSSNSDVFLFFFFVHACVMPQLNWTQLGQHPRSGTTLC